MVAGAKEVNSWPPQKVHVIVSVSESVENTNVFLQIGRHKRCFVYVLMAKIDMDI